MLPYEKAGVRTVGLKRRSQVTGQQVTGQENQDQTVFSDFHKIDSVQSSGSFLTFLTKADV